MGFELANWFQIVVANLILPVVDLMMRKGWWKIRKMGNTRQVSEDRVRRQFLRDRVGAI